MKPHLVIDNAEPFDVFWKAYPRKVAKKAARKAFAKALNEVSLPAILEAIEQYKANKPDYCDYCHPATWLNDGRYEDEYPETEYQWSHKEQKYVRVMK